MRLTQIRDLLAAVEFGSLRAAAQSLGLTQPMLTRSIRELEQEYSIQILERTAHGVVPTMAGRGFIARVRIIQSELTRLKQESAQLSGGNPSITFGVGPPALPVLPGALATFRRRYPEAAVRVVDGVFPSFFSQMRDGRIEFAMGQMPPGKKKGTFLKVHPLYRNEHVLTARRGHPLLGAKSLAELVNAEWLVHSAQEGEPPGVPGRIVPELFDLNGLPSPRSVVHTNSTAALIALLTETDMICALPRSRLNAPTHRHLLQAFHLNSRWPASFALTVCVYYLADSPLTPAAAAMVTAIRAESRKLAFSGESKPVPS